MKKFANSTARPLQMLECSPCSVKLLSGKKGGGLCPSDLVFDRVQRCARPHPRAWRFLGVSRAPDSNAASQRSSLSAANADRFQVPILKTPHVFERMRETMNELHAFPILKLLSLPVGKYSRQAICTPLQLS